MTKDPYKVIKHAYVKEKAMNMLYAELPVRSGVTIYSNKLVFMVYPKATKKDIKWAVEKLFSVTVEKVNTMHTPQGKKAIVKLSKTYSAEEIGARVGIF
jgi:large subunit ribosomal protein L23